MAEKDIVEKILEDYPEVFADIVNVQINVFSIAWMSEEEISRFQSDFRVIADFFRQKRIGKDYIPINVKIRHIDEVLKMLAVFTQDERFMTLPKLTNEGKRPETMCEVYDMIEQKGIAKGIEKGVALGGIRMLCSLVEKDIIAPEKAAEVAGLSEEVFRKEMEMFRKQPGSAGRNWRRMS